MYQYRQIIVQMKLGQSDRAIARTGLVGREKAHYIRVVATKHGWLAAGSVLPNDEALSNLLNQEDKNRAANASKVDPYAQQVTRWYQEGIQATTIFQALVRQYGFDGSYNSVQRFLKKLKSQHIDVTVPLHFKPGEAAQVDFGKGPNIVDAARGQERSTWFFIMTLCYSRHQYAELVWDQSVETWLGCHRRAFEWLNGVPTKVIIDNPKCAITKACYHDPQVQRAYASCAEGYGFIISPCPVADPQKKGRVESGVKYAKKNFMPLRRFRGLADANVQLRAWVLETAGNRTHGSTFEKPLTRFAEIEQNVLKPLPDVPPELATWAKVIGYRNCHVCYLKCLYSFPYQRVGKELWLRATETSVRIYDDHELIAIHPRLTRPGDMSTLPEHLPPEASAFFTQDATWCRAQAKTVGVACQTVVEQLLGDPIVDRLRGAQGVIRLKKDYGNARLEAACHRSLIFDSPRYGTIKAILTKGLEYAAITDDHVFDRLADVYTGSGKFYRKIKTLWN